MEPGSGRGNGDAGNQSGFRLKASSFAAVGCLAFHVLFPTKLAALMLCSLSDARYLGRGSLANFLERSSVPSAPSPSC